MNWCCAVRSARIIASVFLILSAGCSRESSPNEQVKACVDFAKGEFERINRDPSASASFKSICAKGGNALRYLATCMGDGAGYVPFAYEKPTEPNSVVVTFKEHEGSFLIEGYFTDLNKPAIVETVLYRPSTAVEPTVVEKPAPAKDLTVTGSSPPETSSTDVTMTETKTPSPPVEGNIQTAPPIAPPPVVTTSAPPPLVQAETNQVSPLILVGKSQEEADDMFGNPVGTIKKGDITVIMYRDAQITVKNGLVTTVIVNGKTLSVDMPVPAKEPPREAIIVTGTVVAVTVREESTSVSEKSPPPATQIAPLPQVVLPDSTGSSPAAKPVTQSEANQTNVQSLVGLPQQAADDKYGTPLGTMKKGSASVIMYNAAQVTVKNGLITEVKE